MAAVVKKLVRYKNVSGALVKQFETPPLVDGLVDISQLPVVGTMGAAVIERGSNANGLWVKWADGTLICAHGLDGAWTKQTISQGNYFIQNWIYPTAFVGGLCSIQFTAYHTLNFGGSQLWMNAKIYTAYDSQAQCMLVADSGANVSSYPDSVELNPVFAIAIGRWK